MRQKEEIHEIDLGFDGKGFKGHFFATGMAHRVILKEPVLSLQHAYHDDVPVAGAKYEVECENGSIIEGTLDENGQAEVRGLRSRPIKVRYGAEPNEYVIADGGTNPAYIAHFTKADADSLTAPFAAGGVAGPPDAIAFGLEAVDWIWGTVQGGFNKKQQVSQIIVDALIGMIPLVGDVTAGRDILAIISGMARDPKKRESKLEWLGLVVLLFALIPVIGGAIKGVGKLLLRGGKEAAEASAHMRDIIAVLNRLGMGDARRWLQALNLEGHLGGILGRWRELTHRLDTVLDSLIHRSQILLTRSMLEYLTRFRTWFREVAQKGEEMIPESVKELNAKLKATQRQVYNGDWNDIPKNLTSNTREVEARLIDVPGGKKWIVENMHFKPNGRESFFKREGWPDLADEKNAYYTTVDRASGKVTYDKIACYHGPMRAVRIPGGIRIYRVIETQDQVFGSWWIYALPESGKDWREQLAVLKSFSKNGKYVELVVPPEGMCAWEGTASSQVQQIGPVFRNTEGQYLPGGGTQLFIDLELESKKIGLTRSELQKRLEIKVEETGWSDVVLYNSDEFHVPRKEVEAKFLGPFEIESKHRLPVTLIEKSSRRDGNENE